jgi:hypothetical protein
MIHAAYSSIIVQVIEIGFIGQLGIRICVAFAQPHGAAQETLHAANYLGFRVPRQSTHVD